MLVKLNKVIKAKKTKQIITIFIPLFISLIVIIILYAFITLIALFVLNENIISFPTVLLEIVKNIEKYASVLIALVVSVVFQNYLIIDKDYKEKNAIVKKLGSYAINCLDCSMLIDNDLKVVLIESDEDFYAKRDYYKVPIEFITMKNDNVSLKNIVAFDNQIFKKYKKDILKNYSRFCHRISYASPSYIKVNSLNNTNYQCENTFCLEIAKQNKNKLIEFWISAITDEGYIYINKIRAELIAKNNNVSFNIYQQTNFYVQNGELFDVIS